MPDSDLNVQAVDTAINSDGYMPGLSSPTTMAEVRDIYMSSQFPTQIRIEQLQELRQEMVARDRADVEAGLQVLIDEIDKGLTFLQSDGRGNTGPDTLNTIDTAVKLEAP